MRPKTISEEEHSESEFYYPDELEFQENFDEKEETTSISCDQADADQSEENNASQDEIEAFIKEQVRETASDMKTFNRYLSSIKRMYKCWTYWLLTLKDVRKINGKEYMNRTRYQAFSDAYRGSFPMEKSYFNVLIDKEFETSRKVLAAKRKSLVQKAGKSKMPKATRSLTDDEKDNKILLKMAAKFSIPNLQWASKDNARVPQELGEE